MNKIYKNEVRKLENFKEIMTVFRINFLISQNV